MSNVALKYSVLGLVSTRDDGKNLRVVGEFDTEATAVDFIDKVARYDDWSNRKDKTDKTGKPEWNQDVNQDVHDASIYNQTLHIVKTYVLTQKRARYNKSRETELKYLRESSEKDRKRQEIAEAAIKKAGL